ALHAGGEADDQEARRRRAEIRHRRVEPARFALTVRLAECGKPGTERTVAVWLVAARADGAAHRLPTSSSSSSMSAPAPTGAGACDWRCRKPGAFCMRPERSPGSRPI